MARSRYPRVFGSAAAKAQSRAVFAAVGGVTPTPTPTLLKLAAGIARVKAGAGRSVLVCIGDSVTAGWGATQTTGTGGGGAARTNARKTNSWPHKLAEGRIASGTPSRSDAFFISSDSGSTISDMALANPNVTFGTGWSTSTTVTTLGGNMLTFSGAAIGNLVFTPEFSADSFDFLFPANSGYGSFTVTDADGTLGTIDESVQTGAAVVVGATAFRKVTLTRATSSTNPVTVTPTSATQIFLTAIIPFDTKSPRLEILNMGWPGSTTGDWNVATSAWSPFAALAVFSGYADAFLIELGANDSAGSITSTQYQTQLQAIATKVKAYGDVLMIKCHKTRLGTGSYNMPASYITAIDAVQTSVNAATAVDFYSLTLPNPTGYYDQIHLTSTGYAVEAGVVDAAIQASAGA